MIELSIIIPSIRPKFLDNHIKTINDNTKNVKYELLINTSFGILNEIINDEYKKALGKYIALTCDDSIVHKDWARNMIDFMETQPELTLGGFNVDSDIRYYNRVCAIFPFVRRSDMNIIGEFFDTSLKRFYGDIDLSLRYWSKGGNVNICKDAKITILKNRDTIKKQAINNNLESDRKTFERKWNDFFLSSN